MNTSAITVAWRTTCCCLYFSTFHARYIEFQVFQHAHFVLKSERTLRTTDENSNKETYKWAHETAQMSLSGLWRALNAEKPCDRQQKCTYLVNCSQGTSFTCLTLGQNASYMIGHDDSYSSESILLFRGPLVLSSTCLSYYHFHHSLCGAMLLSSTTGDRDLRSRRTICFCCHVARVHP